MASKNSRFKGVFCYEKIMYLLKKQMTFDLILI